jgi:hypothetical protein
MVRQTWRLLLTVAVSRRPQLTSLVRMAHGIAARQTPVKAFIHACTLSTDNPIPDAPQLPSFQQKLPRANRLPEQHDTGNAVHAMSLFI